MAIKSVAVVSMPISDPERAKAFYVDTLGFELLRDQPMGPGMRWIQVAPKGGTTSITLVTWFDTMPAGSLRGLVLRSDDVQADYDLLTSRGVKLEYPPKRQPWATETVFADPDGNQIVLQQV